MENILEPTIDYNFKQLYFGPPSTVLGGAYFSKLMYGTNKPLFIQTPKCLTKQGFVKSGKKMYADLMFDGNDTVFIHWMENLETRCQELVCEKKDTWFDSTLDKDDIENAFTSPFKVFKSGKYYVLRVNVKQNMKMYDENEQQILLENMTNDTYIISVLEIQGIKFTSRNFQIEIELKQSMAVSPDPFLEECFIKKPIHKKQKDNIDKKVIEDNKKVIEDKVIEDNKNIEDNKKVIDEYKDDTIYLDIDDAIKITDDEVIFDDITTKNTESNSIVINNPLSVNTNPIIKDNLFDLEEFEITVEEEKEKEKEEKENELTDITDELSNIPADSDTITLKNPNEIYYEMYKKAKEKAKDAKRIASLAYLEMKNIKKTYNLNDIVESDSEEE